jgi:UDP-GlcNAc:undecaprenyl-phosphate/decaprenyl-phosphate GlcNAc-1-phosphate transferase
MFAFIALVFSSLVMCFVLTPFLRDFFSFLGIVDKPDSYRKQHRRPVPRLGGIGLMVAYSIATIALALGWYRGLFDAHDPSIRLVARLSPAVLLIFAVGLYDDLRGLSPWKKLAGETAAAVFACWAGVHLGIPAEYSGPVFVTNLVSVLWLVLCANAFNLIDGLDGLATGVALIASISLLMAALIHHNPGLALVITPLIGALLGFLYYNFNPASIFLGDCGSLLVGFLLGCYGLMWNQHASSGLGRTAPLIALAFPVFEVMLSITRRFLRDQPIFSSDKNHIHHRILSLGLSHRSTAFVLYGASALVAVVAVLQTILQPGLAIITLILLLAVAYVGLRLLRYPEFDILGKFLFHGDLGRMLRTNIYLHEYEQSLASAKTIEDCWLALRNTCSEADFNYVSLVVDGRSFEDKLLPSTAPSSRIRVALSQLNDATFGHDPKLQGPALLIAPLAERLQEKVNGLKPALTRLAATEQPTERLQISGLKASRAVAP